MTSYRPNGAISTSQWASVEPFDFPKTAIDVEHLPIAPWTLDPTMIASLVVRNNDDATRRGHRRVPRRLGRGRDRAVAAPRRARVELLDALARIGPVENLGTATVASEIETDEVMRDALEVLAKGGTVADAAYAVHMSERTLHRRLSTLRTQLGVRSNTAAARAVLGCAD